MAKDEENKKKKNKSNPSNNKKEKSNTSNKKKVDSKKKDSKHAKTKAESKDTKKENKTNKKSSAKHAPKKEEKKQDNKSKKEIRNEKLEKLRNDKKRIQRIKIAVSCVLGVYALGIILFSFVCYPNTVVADTDLSFKTPEGMKEALIPNSGEYVFSADGFGFEIQIAGEQIEYNFDVDEIVDRVSNYKSPIAWPVEVFVPHDFMTDSIVSFNKETATAIASPAIAAHNEHALKTQNADFVCDTINKTVNIKEEIVGDNLKNDAALNSILAYIGSGRRHLELGDNEHVLPTLYADDEHIPSAIEAAEKLLKSVMPLQMSTATVATIDYSLLATWVHLREGYVAGLNDDLLTAWIAALADQCDTLGKTRTYVTPYGKTCTVSGGDNIGWAIDQSALFDAISAQAPKGVVETIQVPCSSSLNGYGGPGSRDWGARYIDVDLSQQHARMYNDAGELVWESDIVSGKPGENTPTGIYTIKAKKSPTVLIGAPDSSGQPSYRSPVEYWMGFVGDMVGFHDADWQSGFGGDRWLTYGSHGCVNLPHGLAGALYGLCVSGDIVVVHN